MTRTVKHDFGSFDLAGRTFFWKVGYFVAAMEFGSEDPAAPSQPPYGFTTVVDATAARKVPPPFTTSEPVIRSPSLPKRVVTMAGCFRVGRRT